MSGSNVAPLVAIVCVLGVCGQAKADVKSKAAAELAETLLARYGAKAGKSAPALARRIESLAARHGDEALAAVGKCGPSAFGLIEAAGPDAAKVVRVLAKHGEAGASRVLSRPQALGQYRRYGEGAADALVSHPGVAEGLIERGGQPAVEALLSVSPRNGRRLAMLLENDLAKTGRHGELLEVVAAWGNRAAEFCWENKGALAVATVLSAFLANPEPFLRGTRDLTVAATEKVAQPLAREAASSINWNLISLVVLVGGGALLACWLGLFRRAMGTKGETQ